MNLGHTYGECKFQHSSKLNKNCHGIFVIIPRTLLYEPKPGSELTVLESTVLELCMLVCDPCKHLQTGGSDGTIAELLHHLQKAAYFGDM